VRSRRTASQRPTDPAATRPLSPFTEIRTITETEFRSFQEHIEQHTGIHLADWKHQLVVSRLARRLRLLGLHTFSEYFEVVRSNREEHRQMIDRICTNETRFFREKPHYDFMQKVMIPDLRRAADNGIRERTVRVWSAACATGEEPYSIAMLLLSQLPPSHHWSVEILATDLSTSALDRARAGLWKIERAATIPQPLLEKYMLRGTGQNHGQMKASQPLRDRIRFEQLNLVAPEWPEIGSFDLVVCSNVLIYFAQETKTLLAKRLVDRVTPGGHLLVGHAESLRSYTDEVELIRPTVYRRPGSAHPSAAIPPRYSSKM